MPIFSIRRIHQFEYVLLAVLVLSNSTIVLLGRYTRSNVPYDDLYSIRHLIVIIELCKLFLSALLEKYRCCTSDDGGSLIDSIQEHVVRNPRDASKMLIPSVLFLAQNSLLYVALSNLPVPLFQVTYQSKLLLTAVLSVNMLEGRKYEPLQWIFLTTLGIGVAVVVLGESSAGGGIDDFMGGALFTGLGAVFVACLCSSLASVYFEKLLKMQRRRQQIQQDETEAEENELVPAENHVDPPSLWMRTMQLSFFSVLIAIGQDVYEDTTTNDRDEKPYLYGFTVYVWMLVVAQAGGGMIISAVIKVSSPYSQQCFWL